MTPRGQTTKKTAPNCAQRAQVRGEDGVLSISNISDCQPSFWANRTPSMPAPYAVFVKARP